MPHINIKQAACGGRVHISATVVTAGLGIVRDTDLGTHVHTATGYLEAVS